MALTCFGLVLAQAGPPDELSLSVGGALAVLALELQAWRTPTGEVFRTNDGLLLALALHPACGPSVPIIGLFLGLTIRASKAPAAQRFAPFGDPLPAGLATLAVLFSEIAWLPFVVFLVAFELQALATSRRLPQQLKVIKLSTLCLPAALLLIPPDKLSLSWVLLPPLAVASTAAKDRLFKLGADANVKAVQSAKATESVLREKKQQLQRELSVIQALLTGCQELTGDLSRDEVLQNLKSVLHRLLPHDGGAVLEFDNGRLQSTQSWSEKNLQPIEENLRKVAEEVARSGAPLRISDGSQTPLPAPFQGIRSMLGFPISTRERMVGVVLLCSRDAQHFDEMGQVVLGVLAIQAGVALDNSRLYKDVLSGKEALQESQGQLIQAEKLTAIGRLAAGIAHELNTPLGAISLSLEACGELATSSPDLVPKLLGEAVLATEKAQTIIDQLLQYARKSNEQEIFEVTAVILETEAFLRRTLLRDEIELELEMEEELFTRACRQHIHQILTNLILNAKDASPRGGRVRVTAKKHKTHCLISVEDWGAGIPEASLPKLFDPFFTSKEVGQGTGLGLTVALQLAKQHGGDLTAGNKEKGALFTLQLPYLDESSDNLPIASSIGAVGA